MHIRRCFRPRPLAVSLARLSSAVAVVAAVNLATDRPAHAVGVWDAGGGDGFWSNPLNWDTNALPGAFDDVTFGGPAGLIQLDGNQTVNSITFTVPSTLGSYGSPNLLTLSSGSINVNSGVFATINANLAGTSGLNLAGGGSLYVSGIPSYTGSVFIDGNGTSLVGSLGGVPLQANGTATIQINGRLDGYPLGLPTAARTFTMQNGGEFKLIGAPANPDGATKNFAFSGGALNIPAAYTQMTLDDAGQISSFGDIILRGKGRLTTLTQDYNLTNNLILEGGVFEFQRLQGGGGAGTRFSILSSGSTVTLNGGLFAPNSGTQGRIDNPITLNANGALAVQGTDHIYGNDAAGPVINWTLNGGKILLRDAFNPQQARLPRIRTQLDGTGTVEVIPGTGNGGNPRLVLERGDLPHTFSGTFVLRENAILESNPRNGAGTAALSGKTFGAATINLNGFLALVDLRDNGTGSSSLLNTGASDYTPNNIILSSTQVGGRNLITVSSGGGASTGNFFNFNNLGIGTQRLQVDGANSYGLAFNTAVLSGNAFIDMNTAPLTFLGTASESSAGQTVTFSKRGVGNAAAVDVTAAGSVSVSNLNVSFGTMRLRGANGAIGTAFGGAPTQITINGGEAATSTRGNPTAGVLHLDSGSAIVGVAAANNNNRIDDTATVRMLGSSVLRLTSALDTQTTETVNTLNVAGGHALIDVVKTGTAPAPIGFTFNTLSLSNKSTVNFTGTSLGTVGANTSRIVIPGTAVGFMGSAFHSGNEWVKYDNTVDSGVAVGVTAFVAGDYTLNNTEDLWATGQHNKQTGATSITLTGNRNVTTLNLQFSAANQAVNTNGNILTLENGGLIVGANTAGIVGNAGVGGLTAGTTTPGTIYVHNSSQLDIKLPITNNAGLDGIFGNGDDQPVDFVKSGNGTLRLTHQSLGVGTGNQGGSVPPFTTPTWTSTMTGSWIINDGVLDVHRGQFLNGRPIIMNGGTLNVNEPVAAAGANSTLNNWNNNVTVNGNSVIGTDDNGESADPGVGANSMPLFGSLTVNNGATLGLAAFNGDLAFLGGVTFNGRATLNLGANRGNSTNNVFILNGAITGSGFDVANLGGAPNALMLGRDATDTANNTFNSSVIVYGSTLRLNKANGSVAIPDTASSEDLVINGGTVGWGFGHVGDVNALNNGVVGLVPLSPAGTLAAGQEQIADTATVTLLTGTLGENDRINTDTFGTLNQRNGQLQVGLGTMQIGTVNVVGGAFGINNGGTFKAGAFNLQSGAYSPNITTGLPGNPTAVTTLEIGAGGLNMSGQNVILGTGSSGNFTGAGAVLKLGGDVSAVDDTLNANSFFQGIWIQLGNSFREHGNSHVDLMGGNRTFNIDPDVQYFVTAPMTNGGISLTGGGTLILETYRNSDFAGPVVVNNGVLTARSNGAFGTAAGGVTVNYNGTTLPGATVKLESGWSYGDNFTVAGPGALVPGSGTPVREIGAVVSETGTNRILSTATFALSADATIASNITDIPTATPAGAVFNFARSNFSIESLTGITGTGTLTLSGPGDGIILGGVNTTAGGLTKDGSGRWTLAGASTFVGPTSIFAGPLRITAAAALGTTGAGAGTTVYNGGSLELLGGISVAEPLVLRGAGSSSLSGAIDNIGGTNTLTGTLAIQSDVTLRSSNGTLLLNGASGITASGDRSLTLTGAGNGTVQGNITLNEGALIKSGGGTWTLQGTNTFENTTTINGGTLALDYTLNNGSKINTSALVNFGGGNLSLIGSATAATSQSVGGINLQAGAATITVANGTGQSASLGLSAINQTPGGTVNFVLPTAGAITTSTALTNGIIGGFATVGGQDWATRSGFNIAAFNAYQPLSLASASDVNNSRLLATSTLTGSVTTNSLKIAGGLGLNLDLNSLVLSSGGLLYTGAGNAYVTGTGTLSGATAASELIVNTASGSLNIATPIIGADVGALTKTGNGKLILTGSSAFSGAVNINAGTLSIVGPGGTNHPTALGTAVGPRPLNINGGTFEVIGGDYDSGATNMQYVIGPAGGTIRSTLGSTITINDGPGQFSGSGDLTFTGNGRYLMSGGAPSFPNFGGNVTVDGGVLTVANMQTLGGRAEQTIRLKPNSVLINNVGSALGVQGLPNNLILEGNDELYAAGGNRVFTGDVTLIGTNTVATFERDNVGQNRQLYLTGRVSGTGITLNVLGANNGDPFYLTSGANEITGTINLKTNAVLEVRLPGSIGTSAGAVTINMDANSRLFLRHYQNGDFLANVNVNDNAEINSDRMVNYNGGNSQLLSVNNLTVNGGAFMTFGGGNGYFTRIAGTATFNSNTAINAATNALFENGITFAGGATTLDKRGGGSIELFGPATNTGTTLIQGGFVILRGANGSLPNTSTVDLRGGELRIDNSDALNANRLNDSANIILAGGTLRITGNETTITNGTVSAPVGNSVVVFSQPSETVASSISLPGLVANRSKGATVQFQTDFGAFVGAASLAQARISSRILLPGQANVPNGDIIPWAFGSNGLDFVAYDGTTIDNGAPRGVIEYRNNNSGSASNPTYTQDPAETAFTSSVVARFQGLTTTTVLTAARTLRAMKLESSDPGTTANATNRRLDLNGQTLTIDRGAVIIATQPFHIGNQSTATNAVLTSGTNELIFIGNSTIELGNTTTKNGVNGLPGNVVIADGAAGPVSLVKSGTGTLQLRSLSSTSTFTGGVYLNGGTLDVWRGGNLGPATNTLTLAAGTLNLNVPDPGAGTNIDFPGFGHNVVVVGNVTIQLDNNGETAGSGTDNNFNMGSLSINGPYTLALRGFDSQDISFNGITMSSTPVIDLAQGNTGGNATTVTLTGVLAGSGFYVNSSGNTANTAAVLQIGGGDAAPNTYSGKLVLVGTTTNNQPIVQLNKAAGTTAVTGDVEVNGGQLNELADNQIDDNSNLVLTAGTVDFNGKNETIKSVTMRGGALRTNSTGATPANTVLITGDFNATGAGNFLTTDGIQVNSNSTLDITGILRLNGYSKGVVGANAANLFVGGLEMTGTTITQNAGAGANTIRLNGDVITFEAPVTANLGNSTDSDTFLELNGTRTFTVADGPAGLDLAVSSVVIDKTNPAAAGGIIKAGPGVMQLQGGGTANSYTGPTIVAGGSLVLFKNAGVNSLGAGPVTVGDGVGGSRADKLIVRNSDQINDAADVTVSTSGLLDLETFNTSETIASLSGNGAVDLGPASTLTINGANNSAFAGSIRGGGFLVKAGTALLELTGNSEYVGGTRVDGGTLVVTGALNGHTVTVNSGATLAGKGTIGGPVLVNAGAFLAPGPTIGKLNIGDLNLTSGATLQLELNGSGPGTLSDALNVVGSVTLAGDLSLQLNYSPTGLDFIPIIFNDGTDPVVGTFNGLPEGALVGVFNGFNVRITYFGNADGGAVANDVLLQVPEPSSAAVLGAGVAMALGLRRRRKSR